MRIPYEIELAAKEALKADDQRQHRIGAVGIRSDGVVVRAKNGPALNLAPQVHAETRLAKKLDVGSVVFVARVSRLNKLVLAKPCPHCMRVLRSVGVRVVVFTTNDGIDSLQLN